MLSSDIAIPLTGDCVYEASGFHRPARLSHFYPRILPVFVPPSKPMVSACSPCGAMR